MASSGKGKSTSAQERVARDPSPGGSDLKVAAVEAETGQTTLQAKTVTESGKYEGEPVPTALVPSPGGSDMHAEAVRAELPAKKPPAAKKSSSPSTKGAQVTLRGRFSPGLRVQLVKVAGAHVLRTSPADEVLETKAVEEDGSVQFSKGVEDGCRYFVRGYQDGFPLEVRVRGRSEADDSEVLALPPVGYDEVKTRDGRSFPARGQRLPDVPEHLAH